MSGGPITGGGWSLLAPLPVAVAVVAVAATLAAWQLVRARRRPPVRRRRLVALWAALVCLALLALGPARPVPAPDGSVVLWTDPAVATAERQAAVGDGERFVLAEALHAAARDSGAGAVPEGAAVIPDAAWLARRGGVARLTLLGHGLEAWAWPAFGTPAIDHRPPPLTPGVAAVGWPRQVTVGRPWQVEGRLVGLGPGTLRLLDPGGEGETMVVADDVPPAEGSAFRLGAVARAAGRWTYRLVFEPENGAGHELGAVDVEARPPGLPRVLWLEAAPGFETRHLKSWLSAAGGALAVRTVISRDRFRFERLNVGDLDLGRIDRQLLARFDVVVAEARMLATLGAPSLAALRAEVAAGLGLLVLPAAPAADGSPPADDRWYLLPARPVTGTGDEDDGRMAARLAWAEGSSTTPLVIAARELDPETAARPLLVDPVGRVLAAARDHGAGRVALTLVTDTYRWVLEGHPEHHRRTWSVLLDALARPRPASRVILPSGPLLVDRPLPLMVDLSGDGSADRPPAVQLVAPDGGAQALAWRQDRLVDGRWHAVYWPDASGWFGLGPATAGDDDGAATAAAEAAWYVQPAAGWPTWRQTERRRATARHRALRAGASTTNPRPPSAAERPVGRLGLFLAALAALAFLWLDERLARRGGSSAARLADESPGW